MSDDFSYLAEFLEKLTGTDAEKVIALNLELLKHMKEAEISSIKLNNTVDELNKEIEFLEKQNEELEHEQKELMQKIIVNRQEDNRNEKVKKELIKRVKTLQANCEGLETDIDLITDEIKQKQREAQEVGTNLCCLNNPECPNVASLNSNQILNNDKAKESLDEEINQAENETALYYEDLQMQLEPAKKNLCDLKLKYKELENILNQKEQYQNELISKINPKQRELEVNVSLQEEIEEAEGKLCGNCLHEIESTHALEVLPKEDKEVLSNNSDLPPK